jgi:formyltetrahydrofolate synthetase
MGRTKKMELQKVDLSGEVTYKEILRDYGYREVIITNWTEEQCKAECDEINEERKPVFVKVLLERVYEVSCGLKDLGINSITQITNMEGLEMLDDNAATVTTKLKAICLMPESEIKELE